MIESASDTEEVPDIIETLCLVSSAIRRLTAKPRHRRLHLAQALYNSKVYMPASQYRRRLGQAVLNGGFAYTI